MSRRRQGAAAGGRGRARRPALAGRPAGAKAATSGPNAREAVEALLRERLGYRGFRASLEVEARARRGAAERDPARAAT